MWCSVRLAYQPARPASPGRSTEREATSVDSPTSFAALKDLHPPERLTPRTGSDTRDGDHTVGQAGGHAHDGRSDRRAHEGEAARGHTRAAACA